MGRQHWHDPRRKQAKPVPPTETQVFLLQLCHSPSVVSVLSWSLITLSFNNLSRGIRNSFVPRVNIFSKISVTKQMDLVILSHQHFLMKESGILAIHDRLLACFYVWSRFCMQRESSSQFIYSTCHTLYKVYWPWCRISLSWPNAVSQLYLLYVLYSEKKLCSL